VTRRPTPRPAFDARAALRAEVALARDMLAVSPLNDESIHAIRQALKRARAALRLLRDALSDAQYARENACLRDAARPLAKARDASVLLSLLADLQAGPLRRRLLRSRPRLITALCASGRADELRRELERSLQRTARWRIAADDRATSRTGLQRIYRKGRRQMQRVLERPGTRALHEWRKQAKYLAAGLAFLEGPASRRTRSGKMADELARRLGEDHDLATLALALRREGAGRAVLRGLEKQRARLQKRALKLGRRLYKHSPARFSAASSR
jgi:hypothetical protein